MNTATESICPKGWTIPTIKQINNNVDISGFNPVLGGFYGNGIPYNKNVDGVWWGAETSSGVRRDNLTYNGSSLFVAMSRRYYGRYIRCVSEEKTVLDLTYMQDIARGITKTIK